MFKKALLSTLVSIFCGLFVFAVMPAFGENTPGGAPGTPSGGNVTPTFSGLNVTGKVEFLKDLNVTGALGVTGTATFAGSLYAPSVQGRDGSFSSVTSTNIYTDSISGSVSGGVELKDVKSLQATSSGLNLTRITGITGPTAGLDISNIKSLQAIDAGIDLTKIKSIAGPSGGLALTNVGSLGAVSSGLNLSNIKSVAGPSTGLSLTNVGTLGGSSGGLTISNISDINTDSGGILDVAGEIRSRVGIVTSTISGHPSDNSGILKVQSPIDDLNVFGKISNNKTGSNNANLPVEINDTLKVNGGLSVGEIDQIGEYLFLNGNSVVNGYIKAFSGDLIFNSPLNVQSLYYDTKYDDFPVQIDDNLSVLGDAYVSGGNLYVQNDGFIINASVNSNGSPLPVKINDELQVTQTVNIDGSLNVKGTINAGGIGHFYRVVGTRTDFSNEYGTASVSCNSGDVVIDCGFSTKFSSSPSVYPDAVVREMHVDSVASTCWVGASNSKNGSLTSTQAIATCMSPDNSYPASQ